VNLLYHTNIWRECCNTQYFIGPTMFVIRIEENFVEWKCRRTPLQAEEALGPISIPWGSCNTKLNQWKLLVNLLKISIWLMSEFEMKWRRAWMNKIKNSITRIFGGNVVTLNTSSDQQCLWSASRRILLNENEKLWKTEVNEYLTNPWWTCSFQRYLYNQIVEILV
jgi:hypothetical protein